MKVLCINAGPLPGDVPEQPKLEEGKIYHAMMETWGFNDDRSWQGPCYILREIPYYWVYEVERFVPLQDDEEEKVEEKQQAEVAIS